MKIEKNTTIQHVLKYIGIFGSVEMLKILANLSKRKIAAYFLGPLGIGVIAIYMNLLEVIRSCTNIGLETAGIQRLSELDDAKQHNQILALAKTIRTWALAIAMLDVVICVVFAFFFENLFFEPGDSHRIQILLLSPAAFFAPIMMGECAILKGIHKLKNVATVELLSAIATVVSVLIIYWNLGADGIILAMNACVISGAVIHLFFCSRIISYSVNLLSKEVWKRGLPLLKFGIPYFATAFFGAITTTIVYKIISSTEDIGFYRNGYELILYYVGIVFSSNAIDYFPRLTSVCHDEIQKNDTVNKQINVSFTLTTPLVMAFLLAMPLMVLALYTNEFLPIVGMCVMAGLFQLHRSVSLPLEYVSLAHGHSWMFMILESIYNILIIASTYALYPTFGLVGLGISLSFVGLANTIILSIVNRVFYKVSITKSNWILIAAGTVLVAIVMMLCQNDNLTIRLGVGIPLTLLTALYSYLTLKRGMINER